MGIFIMRTNGKNLLVTIMIVRRETFSNKDDGFLILLYYATTNIEINSTKTSHLAAQCDKEFS